MGYIGNQTSNSYSSIAKQTITGDGGTGYTLDHAVANAQEIEVFVNNVRQEPAVAYTVSGTTLTMTGNVAASDDFYVVFQGKALQTTVPPDDSVTTARINDGAVTRAKMANDLSGTNLAIDTTSSTFKMTDLTSNAFYRTGTWSPVLSSTTATDLNATIFTGTLQTQSGLYTRVGDLVTASCHIVMPSSSFSYTNGGANGQHLSVTALPFKVKNDSSYYPVANIGYVSGLSAWDSSGYGYSWHGLGFAAQKYFAFYYNSAGNMNNIAPDHITTSTTIIAQITYETDEA